MHLSTETVLKIERIGKEECAGSLPAYLFYTRSTRGEHEHNLIEIIEAKVESTPSQFTCDDKRKLKLQ